MWEIHEKATSGNVSKHNFAKTLNILWYLKTWLSRQKNWIFLKSLKMLENVFTFDIYKFDLVLEWKFFHHTDRFTVRFFFKKKKAFLINF